MGSAATGAALRWRPLLSGAARRRALGTVDALAESIAPLAPGERDPSLAGGQAGLAVLYAWLAKAGRSPQASSLAWQCLDRAIEAVATDAMGSSFWEGFPGIAWAAELVDRTLDGGVEDGDAAVDNDAVDDALSLLLSQPRQWPAPHDLVFGVTGLGVYALERCPRPSAAECLHHVVERLDESARRDGHGIHWWTPPAGIRESEDREEYPSGRADLGMAHGVAGAIGLLGALCGVGVERATVRPLLEGSVSWLLAQAVATESGPTYPIWVAPDLEPTPARSAWCYGDPGVAAALWMAARGAGRPDWAREAVALACRSAERPGTEAGVVDAGFCHGTAGLAHLYNRLYQATGDPRLGRAAVHWLERTLEWCDLARAGGGSWVAPDPDPGQAPWAGIELTRGVTGIALVLLAAATPVEPSWDRMFLLSAPDVPEVHSR
ncbi:lanthionine synthetase C family protein [Geodermatophilus sp. URMC 65]